MRGNGRERLIRFMKNSSSRILIAVFVLVAALSPSVMADEIISGTDYRIVDGDTIDLEGNRIRLIGIDAPESKQQCLSAEGVAWACGKVARDKLIEMAAGASGLTCIISGRDRYKRLLGTCFAGQGVNGVDLQQALIRIGLAVAEYDEAYRADEVAARQEGAGIWNGCFTRPKDWRRKKRNCN